MGHALAHTGNEPIPLGLLSELDKLRQDQKESAELETEILKLADDLTRATATGNHRKRTRTVFV